MGLINPFTFCLFKGYSFTLWKITIFKNGKPVDHHAYHLFLWAMASIAMQQL